MVNRKVVSVLLAGISMIGFVDQVSASMWGAMNAALGITCPDSKFTIPVTQNSDNKIIWNMDSSLTSRDRCYAKVNSMYSNKYSSEWNDATAECSHMWDEQVAKVARTNAEVSEAYPNCSNISNYISEQTGDRY
ncbi:hypothetical protein F3I27_20345 [Pantoea sp. Bo_2]|uniref:Uncharacterized protein n=1 Tax=Candidatus Pantoea gossypiicola TaxID=2608008 RepID=A0AB34CDQ1_9GAMM|nr:MULTISPECIES: hypothetical protein [Pantoea]KAA5920955.1 hypothetical protein F3I59_23255 [Pantoea sp. VH_8]KAA5928516.1 hypothetical protein F3I58_22385 [Pantoea sp. VH_4]KAA5937504.1 hypothetical protein F3I57_21515 [Pantoea sp. VH_3]KAA5948096.1 hypothetical protein F3I56_20550 [Pantoea sp. VH_25]KAA5948544.1 hypothetical protein F3I55_23485 [Pantoea sp. VH_24]